MDTIFKLTEIYLHLKKEKDLIQQELKENKNINTNVAKLEIILKMIDYIDNQIEIQVAQTKY